MSKNSKEKKSDGNSAKVFVIEERLKFVSSRIESSIRGYDFKATLFIFLTILSMTVVVVTENIFDLSKFKNETAILIYLYILIVVCGFFFIRALYFFFGCVKPKIGVQDMDSNIAFNDISVNYSNADEYKHAILNSKYSFADDLLIQTKMQAAICNKKHVMVVNGIQNMMFGFGSMFVFIIFKVVFTII